MVLMYSNESIIFSSFAEDWRKFQNIAKSPKMTNLLKYKCKNLIFCLLRNSLEQYARSNKRLTTLIVHFVLYDKIQTFFTLKLLFLLM